MNSMKLHLILDSVFPFYTPFLNFQDFFYSFLLFGPPIYQALQSIHILLFFNLAWKIRYPFYDPCKSKEGNVLFQKLLDIGYLIGLSWSVFEYLRDRLLVFSNILCKLILGHHNGILGTMPRLLKDESCFYRKKGFFQFFLFLKNCSLNISNVCI